MTDAVHSISSCPGAGRRGGGFTLIELLAVISIIVILMAIAITTGVKVIGRQDIATTKGLLASLDRALEEYIVSAGGTIPPYIDTAYEGVPGVFLASEGNARTNDLSDGTNSDYLNRAYPRHPDAAVFIAQASGIGAVDKIIGGLGDRFLMPTPTYGQPDGPGVTILHADVTPSIQDPWGDPALWAATAQSSDPLAHAWPVLDDSAHVIFYVHPGNRLAQDLYGQCVNGRPYFFSAGPDGLYGTTSQLSGTGSIMPDADTAKAAVQGLDDNIYSYPVGPAHLDEHFNSEIR